MSNEASVRTSLNIRKSPTDYRSNPTAFQADVTGIHGPTPGAVAVSVNGTTISLAQLATMGGLCRIMNLDLTNRMEVGIKDVGTNTFYPLLDLLPGESYVIRLSRHLQKDEVGTGTFAGNCVLYAEAYVATVIGLFEAFDL